MQPLSTKKVMAKISNIRSATKFKQTVMLIDDQPTVLDIHAAIINSLKLNLNVVKMTDPIEALAWLQNKQVDLIITDFGMHKMDGRQFVQAIKKSDPMLTPSIVVVTVLKDDAIHQELIAAGAAACLTKPVQTQKLASFAKTLLAQSNINFGLRLIN